MRADQNSYKKKSEYIKLSYNAKSLINKMLTKDKRKRISARQALEDSWFEIVEEIEIDEDHAKLTLENFS